MTEQTNAPSIDLGATSDFIADVYKKAGMLNPHENPTELVGLALGGIAALSAVYLDIAKTLRRIDGSLVTIARAQEGMLNVAVTDINEIVKETIEKGIDDGVKKATTERSFIGRVPD